MKMAGLTTLQDELVRSSSALGMLSKGGFWEIKRHDWIGIIDVFGSFANLILGFSQAERWIIVNLQFVQVG